MNRRDFFKIIGVGSSVAISSCDVKKDPNLLIPYLVPPEENIIPGEPIYYKTTCMECPAHCGMSVTAYEKTYNNKKDIYPVKLEGLHAHPISNGALCIRGQASLTRLYHPDRIKNPRIKDKNGHFQDTSWNEALEIIVSEISKEKNLKNIYITKRVTGTLNELINIFCNKMNIYRARDFEYYNYAAIKKANNLLFGFPEIPQYKIENSDFLFTLGADILETFISPVYFSDEFAKEKNKNNFKWYHAESNISLTGLKANKRLNINPKSEVYLLTYILKNLKQTKQYKEIFDNLKNFSYAKISEITGIKSTELSQIIFNLENAKKPLVLSGGAICAHDNGLTISFLTGLIQYVTGEIDNQINFNENENYKNVGTMQDILNLSNDLANNKIGVIFISNINPVKTIAHFGENLKKAKLKIGIGEFQDETMELCDIILNSSNAFESWGDTETRQGLLSLIQPSIKPLYNTLSEGDILLKILNLSRENIETKNYKEFLFENWKKNYKENFIQEFIQEGYFKYEPKEKKAKFDLKSCVNFLKNIKYQNIPRSLILISKPSLRTFDGRSANLQLLNEIPDPLSTISYEDWVSISPQLAQNLSLKDKDEIEIKFNNFTFTKPIKIQPGLNKNVLITENINRDLFKINDVGEAISYFENIKVRKTNNIIKNLPILSGSQSQKGRGIIPDPRHREEKHVNKSLYPEHKHNFYRWAMAIDLDLCTGCSACVAACYIENNIPVVGKDAHLAGHEMSWIRIEPFFDNEKEMNLIPMLCQHCDYAPCEPVCPVYAAYHNPEGLNAQIYNRCVGTRYCSNNCPYKVRRFNWYKNILRSPMNLIQNPNVFVRGKGVMEKCTFCVQRIRASHDKAKDENRKIKDYEVMPACAQTCPVHAITFGNILDSESKIYKSTQDKRTYRVFEKLGTEPSVYYLKS
jgi:molybdopterin-containing oxidoreductase family iron-sulfur binding subunit